MSILTQTWLDIPARGGHVVRTQRGCVAIFRAFDDTVCFADGGVFVPMHWSGAVATRARVGALAPA